MANNPEKAKPAGKASIDLIYVECLEKNRLLGGKN